MSFKQFIIRKLTLFFMLTTLITVAVCAIGSVFDPGARFGYDALLTPVRYAAYCVIPTLVTFSRHELKTKEMMLRMALELLLIEAVVLGIAFSSPVIDTGRISVVIAIAASVLGVYLLSRFLSWLRDSSEARKLNDDLVRFQQLHEQQ